MMEWTELEILRYVYEGWTLSYDKANDCYKLQKRINGKVKSYSLPKRFNPFCKLLRENRELRERIRELERKINYLEFVTTMLRNVMKSCITLCPDCREKIIQKFKKRTEFVCWKCGKPIDTI